MGWYTILLKIKLHAVPESHWVSDIPSRCNFKQGDEHFGHSLSDTHSNFSWSAFGLHISCFGMKISKIVIYIVYFRSQLAVILAKWLHICESKITTAVLPFDTHSRVHRSVHSGSMYPAATNATYPELKSRIYSPELWVCIHISTLMLILNNCRLPFPIALFTKSGVTPSHKPTFPLNQGHSKLMNKHTQSTQYVWWV